MNREDFKRWATASHEAGHLICTHYSKHFLLKDPAVHIPGLRPGNLAEATLRGPRRVTWDAEHAREFSMISFGGYVGDQIAEKMYFPFTVHAESCEGDRELRESALWEFGIYHEQREHLGECNRLITLHSEAHHQIAKLIYKAKKDVPLADVLALLEPTEWIARLKQLFGVGRKR